MFHRKPAILSLLLVVLATLAIAIFRPDVRFDYDFENFFLQDDSELKFYHAYRGIFENDNDYILLALGNPDGIFDSLFLGKANETVLEIEGLPKVSNALSLLNLEEPIISPFGSRFRKVLDWSTTAALQESRSSILQNANLRSNLISSDMGYLLVQIYHEQGISKEDGDILYGQIYAAVSKTWNGNFEITGKIRAQGEFVSLMQSEFALFLSVAIALIAAVLWLIFRTLWGVVLPVLVLGIGVVWAIAIQLWAGKALDLMSVMLPTILGIVGLAALVHFLNKYAQLLRDGLDKDSAICLAFRELLIPVFLTALTTSIGFYSLAFTDVPVLRYFGIFTGTGVLTMFGAVILLTPGLLYLAPAFRQNGAWPSQVWWRCFLSTVFSIIVRRPGRILVGFLGLTFIGMGLASQLRVNGYILDQLPKGSPLMESFRFFDREFGGSKPIEFQLLPGSSAKSIFDYEVLHEIEKLEGFVKTNFGSSDLQSPASVSRILNKSMNGGNPKAYRLPTRGQLNMMAPYFGRWYEESPIRVFTDDLAQGRMTGRTADMGSLISERQKVELQDFLKNNINQKWLLVRLTGTSHLIDISHRKVTFQLAMGLALGFLLVGFMTGILFRSWLIPVLALIPNAIPLVLVAACMNLIGSELSVGTSIIFTVAFGIAVDDTIHFMAKLHSETGKGKTWLYAIKRTFFETTRSISLSSLVLVSGFGILVISDFGVTFYVGLLISLALIFALLADLLLLPVLMIWIGRIHQSSSAPT